MSVVPADAVTAVAKRAVCWLDVFVFAIFVTVGLWLLSAVDFFVSEQRREHTPVKEAVEHRAGVPFLQAGSIMAVDELKMLQSKLFDLRMEATRLATDLKMRARNPRVRLLSPQREQRIKLKTTLAMVRDYDAEVPARKRVVASTAAATFAARHSAELDHDKETRAYTRETKMLVLGLAAVGWVVLALLTWPFCAMLRRKLGHGSTAHVLLPGGVLMLFAFIYYGVK
jgi:hypothetical protein